MCPMSFVEVEYPDEPPFKLFWRVEGRGPPLMLVRGLGRSHRYFSPILPYLAEHFTVVMFDNRGAGQSDHPRGPYSTERMAQDCMKVLDAAGIEQSWLLGMSLGAMIAIDAAHQFPDRVLGLIAGSCTPRGEGSVAVSALPRFQLSVSAFLPKKMARKIQAHVTLSDDFIDRADEVMDVWDEYAKDEPFKLSSLLAQNAAISGHDSVPWLEEIRQPTLLLAGRQDRLVDCRNTPFMASRMPNAEAHIWDDTGHNMETEQPERMASFIVDFVNKHRSDAAVSA
jgi:pimeloyl-ACP methyl ester carboxylesterase